MATTRQTIRGTIVANKRRNHSVNGNPRFDITVKIEGLTLDDHVILTTSTDSACAFDVENLTRSRELVDIGLTKAGFARTIVRV